MMGLVMNWMRRMMILMRIHLGTQSQWVWGYLSHTSARRFTEWCAGKDFDFYGSTAKVANAISEEHMVFSRQAPKKQQPTVTPKVAPTNASAAATKSPEPIPDLQPEMSLWTSGTTNNHGYAPISQYQAPQPEPAQQSSIANKKFMSLEEVEAQILAQSQRPQQPPPAAPALVPPAAPSHPPAPQVPPTRTLPPLSEPPQLQTYNPDLQLYPPPSQYLQQTATPPPHYIPEQRSSPQPPGIFNQLRQPRHAGPHSPAIASGLPAGVSPGIPTGIPGLPPAQPQTEADRARMLEEESRRLKRNHKIAQLVRHTNIAFKRIY